jgi:hypothetical protein
MAVSEQMLTSEGLVSLLFASDGYVLAPCSSRDGGGKTATGVTVRPGGMAPPVARVGPYSYDELTVEYIPRWETDSGLLQRLEGYQGTKVQMTFQPMDENGQAGFHTPEGKSGKVTGVAGSTYSSDGEDVSVFTITILPDRAT